MAQGTNQEDRQKESASRALALWMLGLLVSASGMYFTGLFAELAKLTVGYLQKTCTVVAGRTGGRPERSPASVPSPVVTWSIVTPDADPVGANARLAQLVRRDLPDIPLVNGAADTLVTIAVNLEGSARALAPRQRAPYRVAVDISGLPAGSCRTTVHHEEFRGTADDRVFTEEDLQNTAKAILDSAKRYVSSGGRSCS